MTTSSNRQFPNLVIQIQMILKGVIGAVVGGLLGFGYHKFMDACGST
jgi:hypothetical protein